MRPLRINVKCYAIASYRTMLNNERVSSVRFSTPAGAPRVPLEGTPYSVISSFVAYLSPGVLGTPNTVEISARFFAFREDWEIWSVGAFREDSEEAITPESLRAIPPAEAVRAALHAQADIMIDSAGDDIWKVWERDAPLLSSRRKDGPTSENLASASAAYRAARVLHLAPVVKVAELFGLPQRTATHWVKLARERGHLPALWSQEF